MAPVKYEPSQAKYEHGQTKYEHGQPKYEQEQHTYEQGNHTQSQVFSNAQPKPEKILPAISRPQSPVFTENPNTGAKVDGQLHSIAPSLQIPRSVNNSQGSLAELAAQVSLDLVRWNDFHMADNCTDNMLFLVRNFHHSRAC